MSPRHANGRFQSCDPTHLAADIRALEVEIKRLDQLREADQRAVQEARMAADKGIAAALLAVEKSNSKLEEATNKRFENTNEWRQTYGDLANRGRGAWIAVAAAFGIGAALATIVGVILAVISAIQP